ncbi:hypothetical protein C8J56DRAFT_1095385 [Mycena floridula]|nr:hypothetical protein C8J56DRAFT_1095385 [Mycena floridula]
MTNIGARSDSPIPISTETTFAASPIRSSSSVDDDSNDSRATRTSDSTAISASQPEMTSERISLGPSEAKPWQSEQRREESEYLGRDSETERSSAVVIDPDSVLIWSPSMNTSHARIMEIPAGTCTRRASNTMKSQASAASNELWSRRVDRIKLEKSPNMRPGTYLLKAFVYKSHVRDIYT